ALPLYPGLQPACRRAGAESGAAAGAVRHPRLDPARGLPVPAGARPRRLHPRPGGPAGSEPRRQDTHRRRSGRSGRGHRGQSDLSLLGRSEYGWRFVGSDIDQAALANAAQILAANPTLAVGIELRHQRRPEQIFGGLVGGDERFDFTLCNPPFHADLAEATRGSQRKWRNLGRDTDRQPLLNFGGRHNELMCDAGEAVFLSRMIDQSAAIAGQVFWFTTLVSRAANLPPLRARLATLPVRDVRVIPMGQGQKQSRLLAWTFLDKKQRRAWRRARWPACQTAGAAPEVRKLCGTAPASRGHKF